MNESRDKFLDEANRAYAKLRSDPEAWSEELAERELWDSTLADGLDDDESFVAADDALAH